MISTTLAATVLKNHACNVDTIGRTENHILSCGSDFLYKRTSKIWIPKFQQIPSNDQCDIIAKQYVTEKLHNEVHIIR